MVKAIPDLDLHDDIALVSLIEEGLKALPVWVVPALQIVQPVLAAMEGVRVVFITVAHRVADVIAADSGQQVEVPGQTVTGPLEEIVVRRGAQQRDRFAFVLPVSRVLGPGPDAAFVSRLRASPQVSNSSVQPSVVTARSILIGGRICRRETTTIS